LMEAAKVPVLASTWRPIFMCGLLLASKVWQDLSSWNIEFASVYPQYSLESINRLELHFLRMVKWDLYISSSQYAKYYFALRSLVEKPDFRQRYNRMVGGVDTVHASHARKIEERSTMVKEEALLHLSHSM
jgi:Cyclin